MKAFEILQTVNLRAQNAVKVYEQPLVYGNKGAHRWIVDVLDGRESADLTGCTAVLYISRQDGKTVKITDGITIAAKRAEVLLPAEAYAVEGGTAFELDILEGGRTITCAQLSAIVRRTRTDDVIIPGTGEIYDLPALLAQIDAMKAATVAANTAAANANAKATAADTATANATTATGNANAGANNANKAAAKLNGLTIAATGLETGSAPTAALSEVDGHYHIVLGIPKGDTGATPQISVEVATGDPGSEAQVSVSGTAENPVIHLTIPRGDMGSIGTLTINGKTPDASGTVTLEMSDIPGLPDAIAAHEASIGDAWAGGKTYAVGDYCISSNQLYKCKAAHTAGSAFDAAYWDAVNVAGEVKEKFSSSHFASQRLNGGLTYKIELDKSYNDAAIVFGCAAGGSGILIVYGNGYINSLHLPSDIIVTAPSGSADNYRSFMITNNASESAHICVISLINNVTITKI